jgi:hypothetical protein
MRRPREIGGHFLDCFTPNSSGRLMSDFECPRQIGAAAIGGRAVRKRTLIKEVPLACGPISIAR